MHSSAGYSRGCDWIAGNGCNRRRGRDWIVSIGKGKVSFQELRLRFTQRNEHGHNSWR